MLSPRTPELQSARIFSRDAEGAKAEGPEAPRARAVAGDSQDPDGDLQDPDGGKIRPPGFNRRFIYAVRGKIRPTGFNRRFIYTEDSGGIGKSGHLARKIGARDCYSHVQATSDSIL